MNHATVFFLFYFVFNETKMQLFCACLFRCVRSTRNNIHSHHTPFIPYLEHNLFFANFAIFSFLFALAN